MHALLLALALAFSPAASAAPNPALLNPAAAVEKAPATYKVRFETSAGAFVVEVHRDWAPQGADRFYNLVKLGFYDGDAFFRNIAGFMVQFGIHPDPTISTAWRMARIPDDMVMHSNTAGTITFATSGKDSRTTQVFINHVDNKALDGMGFAPFGQIVEGADVVKKLYSGYGEGAPRGRGPDQGRIQSEGAAYLGKEFPKLDLVKSATIVP